QAFKGVAAGLTLSELCALYFSRTLVEALAGGPFRNDVEHAFEKLSAVLPPHVREFLDRLPRILAIKPEPMQRKAGRSAHVQDIVSRALEATLRFRQAVITYHSKSSDRVKTYRIHPYRLAYAQGGLYLLAYVPEYGEVRTFAVERVQTISLLEERFTPAEQLPDAAFPHSLGVHSGSPEQIEIEFQPAVADYVRAREWHPSQQVRETEEAGLRMTLDVCRDQALRSWILSFGPFARVIAPPALVEEIATQIRLALTQYVEVG